MKCVFLFFISLMLLFAEETKTPEVSKDSQIEFLQSQVDLLTAQTAVKSAEEQFRKALDKLNQECGPSYHPELTTTTSGKKLVCSPNALEKDKEKK